MEPGNDLMAQFEEEEGHSEARYSRTNNGKMSLVLLQDTMGSTQVSLRMFEHFQHVMRIVIRRL